MNSDFDPIKYEGDPGDTADGSVQKTSYDAAVNLSLCAFHVEQRLDGDVDVPPPPTAAEKAGLAIAKFLDVRNPGGSWNARAVEISRFLNEMSVSSEVSATVAAANDALRGSGLSLSARKVPNWNQATPAPYTVSIWNVNMELGNDGRSRR